MSGNNSENNAAMGLGAVVVAGIVIMAMAAFALVAFFTLILSIICLFAWNKRVTLFGEVMEPEDARAFIKRGLVGAGLAWAFVIFCAVLFDFRIQPDALPYVVIAGYCAGSLGVQLLLEKEKEEAAKQAQLVQSYPAVIEHDPKPAQPEPQTSVEPFRFASWDDEIELNKPEDSDRCRGCAWNDESYRPLPGVSQR